ncbi:MAG TPA: carboxylesterase [Thermoanaerobacterales bacterium]|nr:carboxylesterase [Thermoanaerobacterales bacterium]
MLPMGHYFKTKGYTVCGVRLKGHGTTPQDMAQTRWEDWLDSAEQSYKKLESVCDEIYVIGFSMGGILAINLGLNHKSKAVAVISAPIYIMNKKTILVPFLKLFKKYEMKRKGKTEIDKYNIGYDRTPLVCAQSLMQLIRFTKRRIKLFDTPIIIFQSKDDATVNYKSAKYIFNNVKSTRKKLSWLEDVGHMVVLSKEKEKVFREIDRFFINTK